MGSFVTKKRWGPHGLLLLKISKIGLARALPARQVTPPLIPPFGCNKRCSYLSTSIVPHIDLSKIEQQHLSFFFLFKLTTKKFLQLLLKNLLKIKNQTWIQIYQIRNIQWFIRQEYQSACTSSIIILCKGPSIYDADVSWGRVTERSKNITILFS